MRFHDGLADRQAMPLPCGFVVKNASNIWSALPGGSPGPVSLREIWIWPSSLNCDLFTGPVPWARLTGCTALAGQVGRHIEQ
jgi:hypothetical protein